MSEEKLNHEERESVVDDETWGHVKVGETIRINYYDSVGKKHQFAGEVIQKKRLRRTITILSESREERTFKKDEISDIVLLEPA